MGGRLVGGDAPSKSADRRGCRVCLKCNGKIDHYAGRSPRTRSETLAVELVGSPARRPTQPRPRGLLTKGNEKLGEGIYHWNLPAGSKFSCPGASRTCDASLRGSCYARPDSHRASYGTPSTQRLYQANWAMVTGDNADCAAFTDQMIADILGLNARYHKCRVVRLHTSGDFHSLAYVTAWIKIARAHADVRFYSYTRSWTIGELASALDVFRELDNVTLWASTDESMGRPPSGWPEATLVGRHFRGTPVGYGKCPEQTGRRASCSECTLCFSERLRPTARLAFARH